MSRTLPDFQLFYLNKIKYFFLIILQENFINKQQNAISHERKSRLRQEQTEKQIVELFGKKASKYSSKIIYTN